MKDITLFNANCFDIFPKIEKNSVQLVIVDLPYNSTKCSWDLAIDLNKMWIELKRVCKKNCLYVFFCTTKFGYTIIKSNPRWFKSDIIWEKSKKVGFLNSKKAVLRKHELIYLFGNKSGGKKIYNPQKIPGKPYKNTGKGVVSVYGIKRTSNDNKGDRHPHSILRFNNPKKSVHPTQKPVALCEWLIKSYSNENDLVLDFTMGSGTTGVACINTKRRFIGIEMDKDIFKIAQERCKVKEEDVEEEDVEEITLVQVIQAPTKGIEEQLNIKKIEKLTKRELCEFCEIPYTKKHKKRHQRSKLCKSYQYYYELD
jgi:site-specific DNA-methyltransferase (adenine-specific)